MALFRLAKGDESDGAASRRAEIARYVATLAFMQAEAHCVPNHTPHHSLCMSIDVQNQDIVLASRSQTQRINNIRAACRQIARAWNDV